MDSEEDTLFRGVLREIARANSRTPPIFLAEGVRLGPYEIAGLLGRGGMGVVYRAIDARLGRAVALKVLRGSAAGDERRRRFLREARSAAAINHPNVATIYEVGEADEHIFLAMELIEGATLRSHLAAGALGAEEAARIAREVALGLVPAHAKGIVHRDLKPENVMMSTTGGVKVLDFGLAKLRGSSTDSSNPSLGHRETETLEGAVLGTPAYMSPEQAAGGVVDARTDVFALGVVLYELITGVRPGLLEGGPVIEDEALSAVVRRCLAAEPSQRFANATELVAALDARSSQPSSRRRHARAVLAPLGLSVAAGTETTPDAFLQTPPVTPKRAAGRARRAALMGGIVFCLSVSVFVVWRSRARALDVAARPAASGIAPVTAAAFSERRLTYYPPDSLVTALAVAPDGKRYVYADHDAVWIAPTDGTANRSRVTLPSTEKRVPNHIQFFPDGNRLLIGMYSPEERQTWILSLDGAPPVRARDAMYFAISPDGARLAFRQLGDSLVVGALDGGPTTYIESVRSQGELNIAWSPDGRRLAIARALDEKCLVEVARADGSSRKTIVTDSKCKVGLAAPVWTANDRIAFQTTVAEDSVGLMETTLDANDVPVGEPRHLWTRPSAYLANLAYSASRFFFIKIESQRDVYVGHIDSHHKLEGGLSRLTTSERDDTLIGWMPDGRIAYSSDHEGHPRVFAVEQGKPGSPEMLAETDIAGFAVLDGGDVLAFRAAEANTAFVSRVSPDGRSRDLFAAGPTIFDKGRVLRCAKCATAARRCVIGERDGEEISYSLFDPDTGVKSPPFAHLPNASGGGVCSLSENGTTLFVPAQTDGFVEVSVANGAIHAFASPGGGAIQYVGPWPGSNDLLVSGRQLLGHPFAVLRMNEAGAPIEAVWSSDTIWASGPMIARNGRDLALTARPFDTDVFMLEPADAK